MSNIVLLGLGSNIGFSLENIMNAAKKIPLMHKKISCIIETDPLLPPNAPSLWDMKYLNAVVIGKAIFSPIDTLIKLKAIEKKMHRKHTKRWGPRPIDIDILFWGKKTINMKSLIIPHKEIHKRLFTLFPISNISPNTVHPILRTSCIQLLKNYIRTHPNSKYRIVIERKHSVTLNFLFTHKENESVYTV